MPVDHSAPLDVTRITLAVLFIAILMAASFWIVRPFLTSFAWATMVVIATWPALLWFQGKLRHSRAAAVAAMLVLILMVVVIPLLLAIFTLLEKGDNIVQQIMTLAEFRPPPPPDWVRNIPLAGHKIAEAWERFIALTHGELVTQLAPFMRQAIRWMIDSAGSLAMVILQFLLMVLMSGVLYARGEAASEGVLSFARSLAGQHGVEAAILASKAVKGVALGVVLTALIQSFLCSIALGVAGIPAPVLLTAMIFILCLAQLGPILAMIPAIIWLYSTDGVLWGSLLLIFAVGVQLIDNIIRPFLIRKGVDLSLLLIIPGVVGGLIAFGIIGLFIGPVVLAVTYTLLKAWVRYHRSRRADERDN